MADHNNPVVAQEISVPIPREAFLDDEPTPMVCVAKYGLNHIYYFPIDHAPSAEEWLAIGTRISDTMLKDIGQFPQRWKLIHALEWDPDAVAEAFKREPVLVV